MAGPHCTFGGGRLGVNLRPYITYSTATNMNRGGGREMDTALTHAGRHTQHGSMNRGGGRRREMDTALTHEGGQAHTTWEHE